MSGPVGPEEKRGIWVISVIGATLRKLRDEAFDASVSSDGSQIVFRDAESRDIWAMGADGQQAHLVIKPEGGYHVFEPSWLPGAQRIIYGRYQEKNGQANFVLESRDLKGADPVILVSDQRFRDYCLAGDGRLLYVLGEPAPNLYDANLWELRFDSATGKPKGKPRKLTDWTGFTFDFPKMTTDFKSLAFLNNQNQSDVYVGELAGDGSELKPARRLTLDDRLDWPGGWSADSKTVFFYSDRTRNFDIYKQGVNERNAEVLVSDAEEKWAPQASPDGKWVVYLSWAKPANDAPITAGTIKRVPISGGPPENVMDIKGHPGIVSGGFIGETVGGFPSFRCPQHAGAPCVLAEGEDKQITFTAFNPEKGRVNEIAKIPAEVDSMNWDLSPDGTRIALTKFDFKTGDIQIIPVAGGSTQTISVKGWTQIGWVAWAGDGKSLFVSCFSSRGTSVVHVSLNGDARPLLKSVWDFTSVYPSPDGHSVALGPVITNANAWIIPKLPDR